VILAAVMVFFYIKKQATHEQSEKKPSLIASLKVFLCEPDRNTLCILIAIFFWFIVYTVIEAFFTLDVNKDPGMEKVDGAQLPRQLSLIFILFAIPDCYLVRRISRRLTIMSGITIMILRILLIYFLPANVLNIELTKSPVLGTVSSIGLILMVAGLDSVLININSLPIVVDIANAARLGIYTGLYYLFLTLMAIAGLNIIGWIILIACHNYNLKGWQRARAELSNYKKLVEREHAHSYQLTRISVLKKLLVIVDDLEWAMIYCPPEIANTEWAQGIKLIYRKVLSLIEAEGVTKIEADSQSFDPNLHETISHEEVKSYQEIQIIEVIKQGYRVSDRVLHPAMVLVAQ